MTTTAPRLWWFSLLVISSAALAIGYGAGWLVHANEDVEAVQRIVAMSWGDGIYGKAFYGAEVYLEPAGVEHSVQCRVWIGRGGGYFHDVGPLGQVKTEEEAVKKWGTIEWTDAGLTIGPGDSKPFFMSQRDIEKHR